MMLDAVLAYLHHLAAFTIVAVLVAEWALVRPGLAAPHVARLFRIDLTYGIAAVVLLAAGFARVYLGGKGAGFYTTNPFYYTKLGLFAAAGLVSIVPTLRYLRWNRARKRNPNALPAAGEIAATHRLIGLQLLLIAAIPLCAALMARGIGILGSGAP